MLHWQEIVSRVCVREDCSEGWREPEDGLASCSALTFWTHLFQCKCEFGESARNNYFAFQSCVVGPVSQHQILLKKCNCYCPLDTDCKNVLTLAVQIKPKYL